MASTTRDLQAEKQVYLRMLARFSEAERQYTQGKLCVRVPRSGVV